MGAEIQSVFRTHKGKTVGSGIAGVLKVILAELLCRRHVQGAGVHVGDLLDGVVKDLPAGMGGQKLVFCGDLQVPDQRVLELPDNGVGLVVFDFGPESGLAVICPDAQMQVECLTPQAVVIHMDGISRHAHDGSPVGSRELYLLLLRGVVIHSPEGPSAGVVMPVHPVRQKLKASVRIIHADADSVLNDDRLVQEQVHIRRYGRCLPAGGHHK